MCYTCHCCGEVFKSESDGRYDAYDNWVCDSCVGSEYHYCDDCGELYPNDELTEIDGEYFCNYCVENHRCSDSGICGYHTHHSEDPIFWGDSHCNMYPYLGVELEVDKGGESDDTADKVKDIMGHDFIYQESDGSISSGFENITQPATLEYHESKEDAYREMFRYLVKKGYRSHNTSTCGLHVHFNRSFFGGNEDKYIERLLCIVDKFWDNLTKFSRRTSANIDRWAKKYNKKPTEILAEMHEHYIDRYYAVNLSNDDTIEFRLFRGTLNPNSFFATLELVNAIVCYSRSDESIDRMTWDDLLVTDRLKAYWETVKDRVV